MTHNGDDLRLDLLIRQALRGLEEFSPAPDAWPRLAARLAQARREPRPGRRGATPPRRPAGCASRALTGARKPPQVEDTPGA
jgi:hypothetical protein